MSLFLIKCISSCCGSSVGIDVFLYSYLCDLHNFQISGQGQ